ncbi:hypothetical protein J6590_035439 [Homalodisca vitripennis]|nr:hypothetical protein J6590_035439 [Homalodisca vitripennis]
MLELTKVLEMRFNRSTVGRDNNQFLCRETRGEPQFDPRTGCGPSHNAGSSILQLQLHPAMLQPVHPDLAELPPSVLDNPPPLPVLLDQGN